jgi:hypothetical protein
MNGKVKGIVYMSVSMGWIGRSRAEIRNDLRRMREELHAKAVRLEGHNRRLWECAALAKEEGLEVWLHPKANIGVPPKSVFLKMEREFARRAREFGVDVYLLGNELSLEVNLWDDRVLEYTERDVPRDVVEPLRRQPEVFQRFLAELLGIVGEDLEGPIGYVAASWEFDYVDWTQFDLVLCNQFFWPPTQDNFLDLLGQMRAFGKPAVLGECGYLTIDRAFEAGPLYWYPQKHRVRYDEGAQAACLRACLGLVQQAGLDGVFIQEWQDLDDMGFGLVRKDGKPKSAYTVVADFFERFD